MPSSPLSKFEPAQTLDDIHKTVSLEPLVTDEEFDAFYRSEVNLTRGSNRIAMMAQGLRQAHESNRDREYRFFKAFLFGHRGVGKSTEVTALLRTIGDQYGVIRFSVERELDPVNFQPFDVLLLMIALVSERCAQPMSDGGAGRPPSEKLLGDLWDWFSVETETVKRASQAAAQLAAGAGISGDSLWAKALGLFASFKGEIKHTATREKEVVRYRLSRLSELIDLVNRFFLECNRLLREASNRQWLFVGEDFDRYYIDPEQTERFFVTYGNVIKSLETHLVFTIPIELEYSRAAQLPLAKRYLLPDTPVFAPAPDRSPHEEGREALRAVLGARVAPALFAEGQIERLIVASGGNIRDLFTMTTHASLVAHTRENNKRIIEARDVEDSIDEMRAEYRGQLGTTGKEDPIVTVEKKVKKLVAIYNSDPRCDIPDPALYSLLSSRAVQEFDGKRWFGVHPIVVDYLASIGEIPRPSEGPVPGGLI